MTFEQNILKHHTPLILIVDDEETNRLLLKQILKLNKYEYEEAFDGLEGIEKAKTILPDLILLDINMPNMSGFDACKKLKLMPETREIPIIFLTAINKTKTIIEGFNLGAVDYITKPFKTLELLARIEAHIELKFAHNNQKKLINELKKKIDEINKLKNLIPICFHCKKIRDDEGYWENVEDYFTNYSNVEFSHGICPDCLKTYYSNLCIEENNKEI